MSVPYTKQVTYIESTGTQYIDTGFKPNQDTRVICSFEQITTRSIAAPFGCESPRYSAYIISSKFRFDYNSTMTSTQIQVENNVQHEIDFNKNNVYLDGALNTTFTYGNFTAPNLLLFRSTYGSSNFYGRIYWCKVYDNDVLIRDFIPVRVNEVGYFYDKVSGELFNNAGSGYFVFGDDVINHDGFLPFRRRLLYAKPKEQPNYLCFTALESGTFTLTIGANLNTANLSYVEYSLDGRNWVKTNNVNSTTITITTPTVNAGDKVYWRGSGVRNCATREASTNNKGIFSSTCKFDISGNIVSYLFGKKCQNAALAYRAFVGLFINCTNLVNAQDLEIDPATTTYDDFAYLFYGCTSLLTSPNLSKIPINEYIFFGMFQGCTSLVATSELSQTSLMRNCYTDMYRGCTALTSANSIQARSFPIQACMDMYHGCTSLVSTAAMIVDDAALNAFANMYQGCTLLTDAENITINSFSGDAVCQNMFRQCTNLVDKVPTINARTSYTSCFGYMFYSCSKLTKSPQLPAETLARQSYQHMLQGTRVDYVKMLALDISASDCLLYYLEGVPNVSTSIFVKHIDAQWTTTGSSGVPTNWTVIYYDPALDKYYLDQQRSQECDDHGNPI